MALIEYEPYINGSNNIVVYLGSVEKSLFYDNDTNNLVLSNKVEKTHAIVKIFFINLTDYEITFNLFATTGLSYAKSDIKQNILLTKNINVCVATFSVYNNRITGSINNFMFSVGDSNYSDRLNMLFYLNENNWYDQAKDIDTNTFRYTHQLNIHADENETVNYYFKISAPQDYYTIQNDAVNVGYNENTNKYLNLKNINHPTHNNLYRISNNKKFYCCDERGTIFNNVSFVYPVVTFDFIEYHYSINVPYQKFDCVFCNASNLAIDSGTKTDCLSFGIYVPCIQEDIDYPKIDDRTMQIPLTDNELRFNFTFNFKKITSENSFYTQLNTVFGSDFKLNLSPTESRIIYDNFNNKNSFEIDLSNKITITLGSFKYDEITYVICYKIPTAIISLKYDNANNWWNIINDYFVIDPLKIYMYKRYAKNELNPYHLYTREFIHKEDTFTASERIHNCVNDNVFIMPLSSWDSNVSDDSYDIYLYMPKYWNYTSPQSGQYINSITNTDKEYYPKRIFNVISLDNGNMNNVMQFKIDMTKGIIENVINSNWGFNFDIRTWQSNLITINTGITPNYFIQVLDDKVYYIENEINLELDIKKYLTNNSNETNIFKIEECYIDQDNFQIVGLLALGSIDANYTTVSGVTKDDGFVFFSPTLIQGYFDPESHRLDYAYIDPNYVSTGLYVSTQDDYAVDIFCTSLSEWNNEIDDTYPKQPNIILAFYTTYDGKILDYRNITTNEYLSYETLNDFMPKYRNNGERYMRIYISNLKEGEHLKLMVNAGDDGLKSQFNTIDLVGTTNNYIDFLIEPISTSYPHPWSDNDIRVTRDYLDGKHYELRFYIAENEQFKSFRSPSNPYKIYFTLTYGIATAPTYIAPEIWSF